MRNAEASIAVVIVIGLFITLFAEVFYGDVEFSNNDSNTTEKTK